MRNGLPAAEANAAAARETVRAVARIFFSMFFLCPVRRIASRSPCVFVVLSGFLFWKSAAPSFHLSRNGIFTVMALVGQSTSHARQYQHSSNFMYDFL